MSIGWTMFRTFGWILVGLVIIWATAVFVWLLKVAGDEQRQERGHLPHLPKCS